MVLTDLTRWAAIALHNARLFDERVQAYRRLAAEQKRRTAAEMRSAMADVILGMAHTMNNILGAIRVWALILENDPLLADPAALSQKMIGQIRQNAGEAIDLIRTTRGPLESTVLAPTDDCNGDKGQALKVYHDCLKLFEELFGESPAPPTRQLYQPIAADELVPCGPGEQASLYRPPPDRAPGGENTGRRAFAAGLVKYGQVEQRLADQALVKPGPGGAIR